MDYNANWFLKREGFFYCEDSVWNTELKASQTTGGLGDSTYACTVTNKSSCTLSLSGLLSGVCRLFPAPKVMEDGCSTALWHQHTSRYPHRLTHGEKMWIYIRCVGKGAESDNTKLSAKPAPYEWGWFSEKWSCHELSSTLKVLPWASRNIKTRRQKDWEYFKAYINNIP